MSTSSTGTIARAVRVRVTRDELRLDLADGRRLTVPLDWYPRLSRANSRQRANFELIGDGEGIHWPDVDEDLSVAGLLRGNRAPPGSENWRPKHRR